MGMFAGNSNYSYNRSSRLNVHILTDKNISMEIISLCVLLQHSYESQPWEIGQLNKHCSTDLSLFTLSSSRHF